MTPIDAFPISKKILLDIHEAVVYFGLGRDLLHRLTHDGNCEYIVWINNKKFFKREKFEQYLNSLSVI